MDKMIIMKFDGIQDIFNVRCFKLISWLPAVRSGKT